MANSVSVRVGAPGAKQASSEIDQLRDKFALLQKQGAKGFAIGAGAAVTAKALSLVGSGIGDVTGFLEDSVHAYREQEVASNRLTASLKANVAGWNGSTDAIEQANAAGVKLGFTDTDTTNALSLLVAATHDETKALTVLGVAQDLARFKGISVAEAASALTSIEAGRSRGLAQLGINVKDYATTEERLAAVEKVAGGQARIYADSDLGRLDAASAKTEQAQEKLGATMSKISATIMPAVADALSGVIDGTEAAGAATGSFIGDLIVSTPAFKDYVRNLHEARAAQAGLTGAVEDEALASITAADDTENAQARIAAASGAAAEKVAAYQKQLGAGWQIAATEFEGGAVIIRKTAEELATDIAKGILSHKGEAADAMDALTAAMKHPMDRLHRIAKLQGELTGTELAKGLKSKDPYVRAQAQATKAAIEDELKTLIQSAPGYGKRTAKAYADGLRSGVGYVHEAVTALLGPAQTLMKASSPPGPQSPLHEIDKWGLKTGKAWADGLRKGVGHADDFGLGDVAGSFGTPGNSVFGRSGGAGFHGTDQRSNAVPSGHGPLIGTIHVDARGSSDPVAVEAAARRGLQAAADHVALTLRDQTYRTVGGRPTP